MADERCPRSPASRSIGATVAAASLAPVAGIESKALLAVPGSEKRNDEVVMVVVWKKEKDEWSVPKEKPEMP